MRRNWTTRRELIRWTLGAGAVGLVSRFLPQLEAEAEATSGDSRLRYLYWYTPIMPADRLVDPMYQTSDGPLHFVDDQPFAPLNQMADRMLFLRGLNNRAAYDSSNNGVSGGHKSSGVTGLSGYALKNKQASDTDVFEGLGFRGASTFDQWLAHKLRTEKGVSTPLSDIRCGFRNKAHTNDNIWKSISYFNGQMRARHQSPASLFEEMFPFSGDMSGDMSREVPSWVGRDRSVLDYVSGSVKRLQNRVSRADRQRLDQHLTAVAEIERQLDAVEEQALSGASCELDPALEEAPGVFDQVQNLYIKLMVQAFSCDMTRVAGAFFFSHLHGYGYGFLPESEGFNFSYHSNTHGDGAGSKEDKDRFLRAVMRYRAETFIKLLRALEAVEDVDGRSLLDNTLVHWYTDVSRNHRWDDMFEILAGSPDYFRLGQMKTFTTNRKDNDWPLNRLLTSLCHAFGFPEISHFGDPAYDRGALPDSVHE